MCACKTCVSKAHGGYLGKNIERLSFCVYFVLLSPINELLDVFFRRVLVWNLDTAIGRQQLLPDAALLQALRRFMLELVFRIMSTELSFFK
jgi:hypothetical protein